MNKIKNIHQLKKEKKKLREERNAIEKKIENDWLEIRKRFSPANTPVKLLSKILYSKIESKMAKSLLAGEASMIALNLTSNIVETGFSSIKKWFKSKYARQKV